MCFGLFWILGFGSEDFLGVECWNELIGKDYDKGDLLTLGFRLDDE